jgi:hypothetical protein
MAERSCEGDHDHAARIQARQAEVAITAVMGNPTAIFDAVLDSQRRCRYSKPA